MTKIHQSNFGTGKPLVLVHGWAMHSGIWRDFARQLAKNYKVTCVDLPGHGRSEKTDSFTLEQISENLANAVEERSYWLGWSLGATVVIDLAIRFPERVKGLILLAGNPCFTKTAQWPGLSSEVLDIFAENLKEECQATLLRFLSLQVNGLPDAKAELESLKMAMFECDPPDKKTLQAGLELLKQTDLRPVLSRLNSPVSIILGARDTLVPVAVGRQLQVLLPESRLTIIDEAGHVPFLSHQQDLLTSISRFMDAPNE
jgi:pimeloyl-[acyl-carrier protein] methyl ester esterase